MCVCVYIYIYIYIFFIFCKIELGSGPHSIQITHISKAQCRKNPKWYNTKLEDDCPAEDCKPGSAQFFIHPTSACAPGSFDRDFPSSKGLLVDETLGSRRGRFPQTRSKVTERELLHFVTHLLALHASGVRAVAVRASVPVLRVLSAMPVRHLLEVAPPEPARYAVGAVIMMLGVVLPVGYMMFRTKRVPSSSGYSKQT